MKSLIMRECYCLFLILTFLLSMSCSKKESAIPDDIYYVNYSPQVNLSATRTYDTTNNRAGYCDRVPIPSDSTVYYRLDLNNDDIDDFEFSVKRWVYRGSGSSFTFFPCLKYGNFETKFYSLNNLNLICEFENSPQINELKYNDIISKENSWDTQCMPILSKTTELGFFPISPSVEEFYVGCQVHCNSKYLIGWILIEVSEDLVVIKEHAINLTNDVIIAGQKE